MSKARHQNAGRSPADLQAQFQRALALHQRGGIDEAKKIYAEILQAAPDHFGALNLLGVIACQSGAYERAAKLISKAVSINPHVAAAHSNLAVALRHQRRFDDGLASCNKAIALDPNYADAHFNRGLILKELGRAEAALADYDKALRLRPDADTYYSRGNALKDLGRFDDALASYDAAIAARPTFADAHFNRGNILKELSHPQDALASYDRAIALKPDFVEVYQNRAIVLADLGRLDEALAASDKVIALQPGSAEAYSDRATVLQKLGRDDAALESCETAIALRPDSAEAHFNRGNLLRGLGRLEDASDSFKQAISLKPDFTAAYNNIGLTLRELGRLAAAHEALQKAIASDPANATAYFNLSGSKKFAPGDPHLDAMLKLLAEPARLSETEQAELNFGIGKAYADLKDYRRSFEHLLSGNKAKRAITPYDERETFSQFQSIVAIVSRELIDAKSGGGDPSNQPIFILGMPRSGTTLVEQILASHPQVHGAGELEFFRQATRATARARGIAMPYPNSVPVFDAPGLTALGARYLAAINQGGSKSERVTDKMPANFLFGGLIHLALPNARIIHTIRDPFDNCLSCFSILFTNGQEFTYDLGELGRYYRRYERLMAHWRSVLPPGRILDVRYEDVVGDVETQARRILSFCDLPWDERCLSFHETDRAVRTASMAQVRQPIYKSAVGRWRDYEEFLDPLLAALGERSP